MAEKNSSEMLMAFILGGLVGAAVGILYAPGSGKETRQRLKDLGEDLTDKIENISEEVKSKTKQMVHEGRDKVVSSKERIEDAIEAGKKAFVEKKPNV